MDYTKIPQSIVYKKRENLVDFFNNDLNKTFVKNMQEIDILLESDFEAHALICMNAAYYICTLIMLEEYPTWRLTLYDSILCHLNLHPVEGHKKIVFSLVYLMLKHYDQNWQKGHSDFLEKLYVEIYPEEKGKRLHIRAYREGAPRDIFGTLENHLPALVLPNDEFAPRTINNDVVREMKSTNFDWAAITDYYKDNKVKEIIESVVKNLEEKRYIIEILIDSVLKFYTGDNWYKTERMKMLHGLMKEYGGSIEENDQDESDTVSVQYAARIRKLEEENRQLKERSSQLPPTVVGNQDELEELRVQINSLEEEIEYLKKDTGKLTTQEAAIITITACYYGGGWKNRENLHPILTALFAIPEAMAKRRLREGIKNNDILETLARCFDDVSPMIARILREMPETLKNKKKD